MFCVYLLSDKTVPLNSSEWNEKVMSEREKILSAAQTEPYISIILSKLQYVQLFANDLECLILLLNLSN